VLEREKYAHTHTRTHSICIEYVHSISAKDQTGPSGGGGGATDHIAHLLA